MCGVWWFFLCCRFDSTVVMVDVHEIRCAIPSSHYLVCLICLCSWALKSIGNAIRNSIKNRSKSTTDRSKIHQKSIKNHSKSRLGRLLEPIRTSWSCLGASCRVLGASWGVLGASWEASWLRLGASWGCLGGLWGVLGASWGVLGESWAWFSSKMGQNWSTPSWMAFSNRSLIDFWPILAPNFEDEKPTKR